MTEQRMRKIEDVISRRQDGVAVVLEDVHDPHNAAAVLRTCDAFGIQDVFFIFNREKPFDPYTVGKSSSSSANKWLSVSCYTSVSTGMEEILNKGYSPVATLLHATADTVYENSFHRGKPAYVFGNEHDGISPEMAELCPQKLYIPMRGMVESLNISVCAGIVLYECTRARIAENILTPLPESRRKILFEELSAR